MYIQLMLSIINIAIISSLGIINQLRLIGKTKCIESYSWKKVFNTTKNTSNKLKSSFLLRDLLIKNNDMFEKYGCEVEITRTKNLKKLITKTFPEEIRFTHALRFHGLPLILHASEVNRL